MKKIIAILLVFLLTLSLAACGSFTKVDAPENIVEDGKIEDVSGTELKEEDKAEVKQEQEDEKPVAIDKPAESAKPSEAPTAAPSEKPQATSLGRTLLAEFKTMANAGKSAQEIADALLANSAIEFMGGSMPVEPGLLTGFDNTEITGFTSGVMFAPMVGSIAFVGYVFELESSAHASSLIAKLEASANPRWNICVTADEMVTGSAGNKVFFVMCPAAEA